MSFLDKFFSSKPSQREFAELVRREFEKSGVRGLEYRAEDFSLKFPGRDATIFLHNTYANYCALPRDKRKEVVARLVAGSKGTPEMPTDFAAARSHLMPAVRSEAYSSLSRLLNKEKNDPGYEWPHTELAEGLIVGLVYDTEHNMTFVNQKKLTEWGVGLDEALKAAKENLWERTDPKKLTGKNGIYWSEWGDSYDTSRLLLTEFIYRLDLDGEPVTFVPNRDALMITGRNNVAALRVILNTGAETHFNSGHPVSPDLFVLDDGQWKLYVPEDAGLREIWQATRRNRDALDYSQQKQLLEKEPGGEDVFVASVLLFQGKDDGKQMSVCVWTKGIDSLLPRTDLVGLITDTASKEQLMVAWDDVMAVAGNLLELAPGLYPPRYRAREFPSDEQMGRLRKLGRSC